MSFKGVLGIDPVRKALVGDVEMITLGDKANGSGDELSISLSRTMTKKSRGYICLVQVFYLILEILSSDVNVDVDVVRRSE